jgi:DUF4097 and DUF4098 domain-containing protein YvlB
MKGVFVLLAALASQMPSHTQGQASSHTPFDTLAEALASDSWDAPMRRPVRSGLRARTVLRAPPASLAPVGDTVIELRRGDRVVLENLVGDITVGTWARDAMDVRGEDHEVALTVRRSGSTVRVAPAGRRGRSRAVDVTLRVPAWVDLEIGGPSLDVRVDDVDGRIDVRNVSGDIWIQDAGGPVDVRSIEGSIDIVRARGGVRASSQGDDVRLRDATGPVMVHSGSGDVELIDIDSDDVRAETQDGDISFSGAVAPDGAYGFFVHDGDAMIAIPSDADAHVSVSTFDGDFESEFPVRIERFTGGRAFDFTLGAGTARIEIQVFDGEIRLLELQREQ